MIDRDFRGLSSTLLSSLFDLFEEKILIRVTELRPNSPIRRDRSNHQRCSIKKIVLFTCEYVEIFKNTFFQEHLWCCFSIVYVERINKSIATQINLIHAKHSNQQNHEKLWSKIIKEHVATSRSTGSAWVYRLWNILLQILCHWLHRSHHQLTYFIACISIILKKDFFNTIEKWKLWN